TQAFPGAARLMELADNVEKLPTMCRCGSQAEFNCRVVDGRIVSEGEQVAIDGAHVTYQSLCGPCFMDEQERAGVTVLVWGPRAPGRCVAAHGAQPANLAPFACTDGVRG